MVRNFLHKVISDFIESNLSTRVPRLLNPVNWILSFVHIFDPVFTGLLHNTKYMM